MNVVIEPILVSVENASKMLSISEPTFRNLIKGGLVRAVKSGHRTLIPVESLRRYAASLPDMLPTPASS